MGCSSQKRFNSFMKEAKKLGIESTIKADDILSIKKAISLENRPELYPKVFNKDTNSIDSLGIENIWENLTDREKRSKVATFNRALESISNTPSNFKKNKNQQEVYNRVKDWLVDNYKYDDTDDVYDKDNNKAFTKDDVEDTVSKYANRFGLKKIKMFYLNGIPMELIDTGLSKGGSYTFTVKKRDGSEVTIKNVVSNILPVNKNEIDGVTESLKKKTSIHELVKEDYESYPNLMYIKLLERDAAENILSKSTRLGITDNNLLSNKNKKYYGKKPDFNSINYLKSIVEDMVYSIKDSKAERIVNILNISQAMIDHKLGNKLIGAINELNRLKKLIKSGEIQEMFTDEFYSQIKDEAKNNKKISTTKTPAFMFLLKVDKMKIEDYNKFILKYDNSYFEDFSPSRQIGLSRATDISVMLDSLYSLSSMPKSEIEKNINKIENHLSDSESNKGVGLPTAVIYSPGGKVNEDVIDNMTRLTNEIRIYESVLNQGKPVRKKINIRFSLNENSWLSNLSKRPFEFNGKKYNSVEHAYQTNKSGEFDKDTYDAYDGKPGVKIIGKKKENSRTSIDLMQNLVYESFKSNEDEMIKLISLGNVEFSHEKSNDIWSKEFPKALQVAKDRLLMESFGANKDDIDNKDEDPITPPNDGGDKTSNPIKNAKVKDSVRNSKHFQKDINMGEVATQFIGKKAKDGVVSSTEAYMTAWGDKANTGDYSSSDTVMISGSGPWRGVTQRDIQNKFDSFYKGMLDKVMTSGAKVVVGNANGMDRLVIKYLKSNGYDIEWNNDEDYYELSKKNNNSNSTSILINEEMFKSLQGKFKDVNVLSELKSIEDSLFSESAIKYDVDLSNIDIMDDPMQYNYISAQIGVLTDGKSSGKEFMKYDTLLSDKDKVKMAKLYDKASREHTDLSIGLNSLLRKVKTYNDIAYNSELQRDLSDKHKTTLKEAIDIFKKYDKNNLISESNDESDTRKANNNNVKRMMLLAHGKLDRISKYNIKLKDGVIAEIDYDNLVGSFEITNRKELSKHVENDKNFVYSLVNEYLLNESDVSKINIDDISENMNKVDNSKSREHIKQAWYNIDSKELITKVYKEDLERIKVNKIDSENMKRTNGLGFTPSTIKDNIDGLTREDSTGIYEAMNQLFGGSWNRIESKYLERYGYPTKKELEEFNELNKSGILKKVALHKFETGVYKTKKEAEEQLNKNMRRYIEIQDDARKALNIFMKNEGKALLEDNEKENGSTYDIGRPSRDIYKQISEAKTRKDLISIYKNNLSNKSIQKEIVSLMKKRQEEINNNSTNGYSNEAHPPIKSSKGSSQNESKSAELLMNRDLTVDNIGETFVELATRDMGNGKRIAITEDFNNHTQNIFDSLKEVIEATGMKIELQWGRTEDDTSGRNNPGYDYNSKTDNDKISVLYNDNDNTSSSSEVYLHELLHSLFKRAIVANPKIKNQMQYLKDTLLDLNIDKSVFTVQAQQSGVQLTADDMARAKEKYDYALGKDADIEEFMAYVMSNSWLYNQIKDIEVNKNKSLSAEKTANFVNAAVELKNKKNISSFGKLFTSLFSLIVSNFKAFFRKNGESKSAKDIMTDTIHDMAKFQLKMEHKLDDKMFHETLMDFSDKIDNGVIGSTIHTSAILLEKISEAGLVLTRPIKVASSKLFELKNNLIEDIRGNARAMDIMDGIAKIGYVEKVLKSRLLKSLIFQNFTDKKYDKILHLHRTLKQSVDAAITNIKDSINNEIKNKSISSEKNMHLADTFVRKMLRNDISRYLNKINLDNLSKDSLLLSADGLKVELENMGVSDKSIESLNSLASHLHDGRSHNDFQEINAQNILNIDNGRITPKMLSTAKEYVSFKSASMMSDEDLDNMYNIVSDESMMEDVNSIIKSHTTRIDNASDGIRLDEYNSMPMGYIDYDTGKAKYSISIVSVDDYDAMLHMNPEIIGSEFEIYNKKFYRVKHVTESSDYDDGILGSITIKTGGNGIKSILQSIYMQNESNGEFKLRNPTMSEFISKEIDTMRTGTDRLFKSKDFKLMPLKDEDGNIKDWIVPFSNDDINLMEADTRITSVIPHTQSRLIDSVATNKNNEAAIDGIAAFHVKNKDDSIDFMKISRKKTPLIWDRLSPAVKKYINDKYDGKLMVPDDILEVIVGARTSSMANVSLKFKDEEYTVFKNQEVRKYIKMAEKVVGEILSKNKMATILFNPDISIGNMISNMMLMWTHGVPPVKYIREFKKKWSQLGEYEKLSNRLSDLKIKESFGDDVENQIKSVRIQIDKHPFHTLVQDGQFTPMMEDMDSNSEGIIDGFMSDYIKKDSGSSAYMTEIMKEAYRVKAEDIAYGQEIDTMDKYIEEAKLRYDENRMAAPAIVGKVSDVLYGSKGTSAHKMATKLVMYSDTLARQMLLDKMESDKRAENSGNLTENDRQQILNFVDKQFINYGYNVSGIQLWVEKIAGVQFLKYLFQHHKAYAKVIEIAPQRVLAQQGAQYATGINVADPMDTLTSKGPLENLEVRWRLDEPIGALEEAMTPNILMPFGVFDSNAWFKTY